MDREYGFLGWRQPLEEEMKKVCADVQANGSAVRQAVVQRFRSIICGQNRSVNVECYGSSSTGLFVKDSDVDLVILVPADQLQGGHKAFLTEIYEHLLAYKGTCLDEVTINTTPFPLVKALDHQSGLEVGIICAEPGSVTSGLQNSQWIRSAIAQHPSVTYLVVVLKNILRRNNLPNITGGGISSYALTLMAISYVQHTSRQYNLGDLLLGFLYLYGCEFNYWRDAIVLTNGGCIVGRGQLRGMKDLSRQQLVIQDPVDPTKNAAERGVQNVGAVQNIFKTAYEVSQSVRYYPYTVKDFAGFWKWFLTSEFVPE